jgi:hypothetical protein
MDLVGAAARCCRRYDGVTIQAPHRGRPSRQAGGELRHSRKMDASQNWKSRMKSRNYELLRGVVCWHYCGHFVVRPYIARNCPVRAYEPNLPPVGTFHDDVSTAGSAFKPPLPFHNSISTGQHQQPFNVQRSTFNDLEPATLRSIRQRKLTALTPSCLASFYQGISFPHT